MTRMRVCYPLRPMRIMRIGIPQTPWGYTGISHVACWVNSINRIFLNETHWFSSSHAYKGQCVRISCQDILWWPLTHVMQPCAWRHLRSHPASVSNPIQSKRAPSFEWPADMIGVPTWLWLTRSSPDNICKTYCPWDAMIDTKGVWQCSKWDACMTEGHTHMYETPTVMTGNIDTRKSKMHGIHRMPTTTSSTWNSETLPMPCPHPSLGIKECRECGGERMQGRRRREQVCTGMQRKVGECKWNKGVLTRRLTPGEGRVVQGYRVFVGQQMVLGIHAQIEGTAKEHGSSTHSIKCNTKTTYFLAL